MSQFDEVWFGEMKSSKSTIGKADKVTNAVQVEFKSASNLIPQVAAFAQMDLSRIEKHILHALRYGSSPIQAGHAFHTLLVDDLRRRNPDRKRIIDSRPLGQAIFRKIDKCEWLIDGCTFKDTEIDDLSTVELAFLMGHNQDWNKARRAILNAAKSSAQEDMAVMIAKATLIDLPKKKPEDPLRPIIECMHKFGDAKIIRFQLVAGGAMYYIASYKGKKAESGAKFECLKRLRQMVPRPHRVHRVKGEIIGIRGWRLQGEWLAPLAQGDAIYDMNGPVMTADRKPVMTDSHGFWAVKTDDPNLIRYVVRNYQKVQVVGFVSLFGRVVEHEIGYRAEKMAVRRLMLLIPSSKAFRECLADRYQCDVLPMKEGADPYEWHY